MNVLLWLFFGVRKRMGLVLRGSYQVGAEMTVDHIGAFWHRPLSVSVTVGSIPGFLFFPWIHWGIFSSWRLLAVFGGTALQSTRRKSVNLLGRSVFPSPFSPALIDLKPGSRATLPQPVFEPTQEGKNKWWTQRMSTCFLLLRFWRWRGKLRATSGKHGWPFQCMGHHGAFHCVHYFSGMKNGHSWLTGLSRLALDKNLVLGCIYAHSDSWWESRGGRKDKYTNSSTQLPH